MSRRFAPHVIWALLGAASTAALWFVYSIAGAVLLAACIGGAFLLWYYMTPRGAWVAAVVLGVSMSAVLATQAITGSRCPEPGTKVFLKENKPPVSCDEIRASAGAMSIFFALVALGGLIAPVRARALRDEPSGEQSSSTPAQG